MTSEEDRERFERIEKMLSRMDERLGSIERFMAAINERCPHHSQMMADHHLILLGRPDDAKGGLVHRLAAVEASVDVFRVGIKTLWGVITAIVVALLSAWLGNRS